MNEPTPNPHCCLPDCGEPADWAIYDQRDRTPDAVCSTHSCSKHVGDLLGTSESLPAASAEQPEEYLIVPIQ